MNSKGRTPRTYKKTTTGAFAHRAPDKVICFTCRHLDGRKKCQKKNQYLVGWQTKKPHECSMYVKKPLEQMPKPRQPKMVPPDAVKKPLPVADVEQVVDKARKASSSPTRKVSSAPHTRVTSRKKPPTASKRHKV
jgi:hypothetical protein